MKERGSKYEHFASGGLARADIRGRLFQTTFSKLSQRDPNQEVKPTRDLWGARLGRETGFWILDFCFFFWIFNFGFVDSVFWILDFCILDFGCWIFGFGIFGVGILDVGFCILGFGFFGCWNSDFGFLILCFGSRIWDLGFLFF